MNFTGERYGASVINNPDVTILTIMSRSRREVGREKGMRRKREDKLTARRTGIKSRPIFQYREPRSKKK